MNKIDYSQYVVVSDFDGTISLQDSNEQLFKVLGNAENIRIEELYNKGRIGTREGFIRHFETLKLEERTYNEFILENIKMDRSFRAFYNKVIGNGMSLIVVSGGFINGISILLKKEGMKGIPVCANRLVIFNGRLKAEFANENYDCSSSFGACGNCKLLYLKSIRENNKKIIFIGDGLTDRCAASEADIVFAKKSLAKYCESKGIRYIKYDSFEDIINELFA
ncbi:MAG: hypothetical protein APF77_04805 [Clostridia bacterium BRH_c25]|nr:MAG: hypothetical protein APF77_04805 [Clostridia bacterium BRH_c25]